jgi:ElaB/YqjD/DUF883 family membrane-anchored ribosome-binding protein
MSTVSELRQKADDLRELADEIETILDDAYDSADTEEWECPNADDVRGQLSTYQTNARNAATHLRNEATSADNAADAAEEDETD